MPRLKTNYSKTVIYKIVCNDLNVADIYVGHTTQFTKRKNKHKSTCNAENGRDYNTKVYQTIRATGGWEKWSMIEIEKFPCKDKNEAHARERHWYEELKAKLNTQVPNRSQKEWEKEHAEYMKERQKKYNEDHKEHLKEKIKQYNAEHTEEKKEYNKTYYEKHTEDIKKNALKWYNENKVEYNKKRRERYAKKRAETQ